MAAARTVGRHFMSWTFGLGRGIWLLPLDLTFRSVGIRYGWLKWLFETVPPPVLAVTGQLRAERAAWRAIRRVPAYRDYLERNQIDPDGLPPAGILRAVPETDKARYIDPYPIDRRCIDGRIGFKGVTTAIRLAHDRSRGGRAGCLHREARPAVVVSLSQRPARNPAPLGGNSRGTAYESGRRVRERRWQFATLATILEPAFRGPVFQPARLSHPVRIAERKL